MDCGAKCSQYLLFIFNFIFFLTGIAVLSVGSVMISNEEDYIQLIGTNLFSVCVLLIVVGVLVAIIGFFGCCGAIRKSRWMLYTYAGLLCLIFVMEFGGGIAAFVYRDDIRSETVQNLNATIPQYNDDSNVKSQWDHMQQDLGCCGADKPSDWAVITHSTTSVPQSCCLPTYCDSTKGQDNISTDIAYPNGCVTQIEAEIESNALIIGGVAIGIAFVQIFGIVLACCLASAIKD